MFKIYMKAHNVNFLHFVPPFIPQHIIMVKGSIGETYYGREEGQGGLRTSLVPSPTLGRWVWLPVYSKLGQHYVSGPRSGPAM